MDKIFEDLAAKFDVTKREIKTILYLTDPGSLNFTRPAAQELEIALSNAISQLVGDNPSTIAQAVTAFHAPLLKSLGQLYAENIKTSLPKLRTIKGIGIREITTATERNGLPVVPESTTYNICFMDFSHVLFIYHPHGESSVCVYGTICETRHMDRQPGYHIEDFPKGTYGELSKIKEELSELEDAVQQDNKIMAAVELSDIYGALEEYASSHFNLTMADLATHSDATKRAFKNGLRK